MQIVRGRTFSGCMRAAGRLGISTSHSVVGPPAVCRNGDERPAPTRPAGPRWAGGPHLYSWLSPRGMPSKIRWRNDNLKKNAEDSQISAGYVVGKNTNDSLISCWLPFILQANTRYVHVKKNCPYVKKMVRWEKGTKEERKKKEIFSSVPRHDSAERENRDSVKVNEKSKKGSMWFGCDVFLMRLQSSRG